MNGNHDERCAADLAQVAEGRNLPRGEADRLARAVTGAVRPNRDKPFWDLAHALVALAALPGPDRKGPRGIDPARLVTDLILNPHLASGEALRRRVTTDFGAGSSAVSLTQEGIALSLGETRWRTTWAGLTRCLSLAEFLMTCDDLGSFGIVTGLVAEAVYAPDADALTRRLVQIINAYRQAHLPAAAFERRFRAILGYMGEAKLGTTVNDAVIAGFWRQEISAGERPHFRTVAEHFVTFVKLTAVLRGLANVRGAGSLEDIEGWQDRLDGMLTDVACGEEATALVAARLAQIPEMPKILTGAERDDMIAVLGLDDFHRSLPLTVLRAVSFGLVQSGIVNRLRRGSGGATAAQRAACDDAVSYTNILTRIAATQEHLRRMLKIALALRMDGGSSPNDAVATLVNAAEADIKRVRRAGFDQPRERLAAAFASVDQMLAETAEEMQAFIAASGKFGGANALAERHAEDRHFFAEGLIEAYSGREAMASDHDSPHKNGDGPFEEELMNAQFLASWHGARQLQRQIAVGATAAEKAAPTVSVHDLWQYANRKPGEPVSLMMERAIRSDPGTFARYKTILSGSALAHAPLARAASDGKVTSRRVGLYTFEVIDGGDTPILLIRLEDGARPPGAMELRNGDESLRVALAEPVNKTIFLSLDPAHTEGRQLSALIGDPSTEIFVL